MNNKGFTLIELVATIALLAILSVISIVSINSVLEKRKVTNCESIIDNINIAIKEYVSDNRYGNVENSITADKLINEHYLTNKIVNPFTDRTVDPKSIKISIKLENFSFESATIMNSNNVVIKCSDENTFSKVYID